MALLVLFFGLTIELNAEMFLFLSCRYPLMDLANFRQALKYDQKADPGISGSNRLVNSELTSRLAGSSVANAFEYPSADFADRAWSIQREIADQF